MGTGETSAHYLGALQLEEACRSFALCVFHLRAPKLLTDSVNPVADLTTMRCLTAVSILFLLILAEGAWLLLFWRGIRWLLGVQ